ncbi:PP2C family serine/threonine-protein phosphatase [Methylocystis suflitae]|uniref:PP2C family serine/threonine-protein phosphatase n=1 Tax=Methylocystis suflitae TaxID=2951405 RepID=UPI00210C0192|nr:PP2C family serine/threonine-protein phosphatase [Methylocystis suflitae]MCQ4188385.1 protein phosphatase 2C domain-containing protein [Methylocystis suflitae]
MNKQECWTWAGAKVAGTSHIKSGLGCDDNGICSEVATPRGPVLVAVVSDGAGSARYSAIGSALVCVTLTKLARGFVAEGYSVSDISHDVGDVWLTQVRERISISSSLRDRSPREYAATLVAAIIGPADATFLHVGDGGAVIKCENEDSWEIPSWPTQGEFASTTFFVTDDKRPPLQHRYVDRPVRSLGIFTDGLERLILDFTKKVPFDPFFDKVIAPLRAEATGRSRRLSRELERFLDSASINDRTDDDKTLILANRKTVL